MNDSKPEGGEARAAYLSWTGALIAAVGIASVSTLAFAQDQMPAAASEESDVRAELQRIIAEVPAQADAARKALNALNQPATSQIGRQSRNRRATGARRIVNGLAARGYPAVGALLKGGDPASAGAWCTGTLVGCDKFLTAAHCIAKDPSPASYSVFFQETGFFKVKHIAWPKAEYKFPYFDLAMITLDRSVEGVAPMPINMTTKPLNKQIATIVGFGRTGGARFDYGIKREGSASIASCEPDQVTKKLLCWRYEADVQALSEKSNTCNGDSGGGVFIADTDDGRVIPKVFGVVSGGRESDCIKDDLSYNVDVREFTSWIKEAGEGRLGTAICGVPLPSDPRREPQRLLVRLSKSSLEAKLTVEVPPYLRALRVALNGEDNGMSDFDLKLLPPTANEPPVCVQDGSGQFGFCEISSPAPGRWTAIISRKTGEGDAQVTATFVEK